MPCSRLPYLDSPVDAGRGNVFAIRGPGHSVDIVRMAAIDEGGTAGIGVPYLGGSILTGDTWQRLATGEAKPCLRLVGCATCVTVKRSSIHALLFRINLINAYGNFPLHRTGGRIKDLVVLRGLHRMVA